MNASNNKTGLNALLSPEESVLVLIDHQPFQFANLHSPRANDGREQRHRPGKDRQNLQRSHNFDDGAGGTRRVADQGIAGRFSGTETNQPHLHQHLAGQAGG